MKTVTEKRYFVTTKFEKYGTYTIMARSKEHAIQMWKDGDWNFDDYESDYGEYNEVIDEVEEEVFADTQLSLEGVMQPVKCNPNEYTNKMENYLNLFEHIPEDEHNHISNKIWEALDRAGIELSQDAELSIRIYDDEYEGDFDGREYDE